ncbi:MAG: DJ-1/PfpI family protein [Anaerolinea sp.]|nr:DJ-1/PfpI family protein [Anaerolinea sp.]
MHKNMLAPANKVYILIAPGFDEEAVVSCLCQMRRVGTAVTLVGTPALWITGATGLAVQPDCSLDAWQQAAMGNGRCLIVIAGGQSCTTRLLSDARVYQGLRATLSQGGSIAILSRAILPVLSDMRLWSATAVGQFLLPENGETAVFIRDLVHFTVVALGGSK